jgi:hypothetical protein
MFMASLGLAKPPPPPPATHPATLPLLIFHFLFILGYAYVSDGKGDGAESMKGLVSVVSFDTFYAMYSYDNLFPPGSEWEF